MGISYFRIQIEHLAVTVADTVQILVLRDLVSKSYGKMIERLKREQKRTIGQQKKGDKRPVERQMKDTTRIISLNHGRTNQSPSGSFGE